MSTAMITSQFQGQPKVVTSTTMSQGDQLQRQPRVFTSTAMITSQRDQFQGQPRVVTSTSMSQGGQFQGQPRVVTSNRMSQGDQFQRQPRVFMPTAMITSQRDQFQEQPRVFTSTTMITSQFQGQPKVVTSTSMSQGDRFQGQPRVVTSTTMSQGDQFQGQPIVVTSTSMSQGDWFQGQPRVVTSTTMSQGDQFQRQPRVFMPTAMITSQRDQFQGQPRVVTSTSMSQGDQFQGQPRVFMSTTMITSQRDQFQGQLRVLTAGSIHSRVNISGWKAGESAPRVMYGCESGAVISGNLVLYFNPSESKEIYAYDHTLTTNHWSRLSDCPHMGCSLAVINGTMLTTIGGGYPPTNTLFSLIGGSTGGVWTEMIFPPMPTKRRNAVSLCTGTSLIVAGGWGTGIVSLKNVEVLNTETYQWSRVTDLPQPMINASATLFGNHIYLVGRHCRSVYTCSVNSLLESRDNSNSQLKSALQSSTKVIVWKRIDDVPLRDTTCVSIRGELLVVGGVYVYPTAFRPSKAIYIYDSTFNSWRVISHMSTSRSLCFAAVLPDNKLMVVGGIANHVQTNSVEFAMFT